MFGLSFLVTVIIWAVVTATALGFAYGAWHGFKHWIAEPYVSAQIKADQAKIDKAEHVQKVAEQERDNAQIDTEACADVMGDQSGKIDVWKAESDKNLGLARTEKAKADKAAAAIAPYMAELKVKAAAAPKLETCEVELGKAKDTLRTELLRRRGGAPK